MRKPLTLCTGLALAFVLMLAAPAAFAATDVTGIWTAQIQTPNGDMTLTFHFKQDVEKLTGSVDTGGDPVDISNGKIDGDKISFDTSFNGMTIHHTGTIAAEEIKLNVKSDSGQMPDMEMTLKRGASEKKE